MCVRRQKDAFIAIFFFHLSNWALMLIFIDIQFFACTVVVVVIVGRRGWTGKWEAYRIWKSPSATRTILIKSTQYAAFLLCYVAIYRGDRSPKRVEPVGCIKPLKWNLLRAAVASRVFMSIILLSAEWIFRQRNQFPDTEIWFSREITYRWFPVQFHNLFNVYRIGVKWRKVVAFWSFLFLLYANQKK